MRVLVLLMGMAMTIAAQDKPRARDLGVPFEGATGPLNAPFDKWAIVDTFDTVAGCKKSLVEYLQKASERREKDWPNLHYVATYGRCIATDDPRLKGK